MDTLTGLPVAVKTIDTAACLRCSLDTKTEEESLQQLRHPSIVKLLGAFEDDGSRHVVQELCNSGDLFDHVLAKDRLGEAETKHIMFAVLSALAHVHAHGVTHRDLKPENILLHTDDAGAMHAKLADFGAATFRCHQISKGFGSPSYQAPEIVLLKRSKQPYGNQCDVWSAGVVLFFCLSGRLPFNKKQNIAAGRFRFYPSRFLGVSEEAKDLVKALLHRDPAQRLTASQALQSSWFDDIRTAAPTPTAPTRSRQQTKRRLEDTEESECATPGTQNQRVRVFRKARRATSPAAASAADMSLSKSVAFTATATSQC